MLQRWSTWVTFNMKDSQLGRRSTWISSSWLLNSYPQVSISNSWHLHSISTKIKISIFEIWNSNPQESKFEFELERVSTWISYSWHWNSYPQKSRLQFSGLEPLSTKFQFPSLDIGSQYPQKSKGEGESVLCEGIWYGNLQFCPKWLSEGLKKSKISCSIQKKSRLIPSTLWISWNFL